MKITRIELPYRNAREMEEEKQSELKSVLSEKSAFSRELSDQEVVNGMSKDAKWASQKSLNVVSCKSQNRFSSVVDAIRDS